MKVSKKSFRNCSECAYRMTIRCFNNIDEHACSFGHKQYERMKTKENLKRLREALNGQ